MRSFSREEVAQTGMIPEGMQLIRDTMPLKILDKKKIMTESVSGQKLPAMRLTGLFQRADTKNANGRVYPLECLKEAITSLQEPIKHRRVLGEWDHPQDSKIHMDRVSHLITKLWLDNKDVLGELEVINDDRCPCGSMFSCYIDRSIQVGISSRGVGDMEMCVHEGEDAYEVQPGFQFVTFDAVAEPSVQGAQLRKIEESYNRIAPRKLKIMREELLKREFRRFLRSKN